MTYEIPEQNLATLEKRLAALGRRTVKAGNVAVTCTRTGKFRDEPSDCGPVRFVEIDVTGDIPACNGWQFLATLCRTEEGNIVRSVPGYDVPPDYRDGAHTCDHCNTNRQRRDTYVLRHDDGRTVRVGSSCLRDFLQHTSANGVSLAARLCMEAHSMAESATERGWLGGSGGKNTICRIDLPAYLGHVAQAVMNGGKFVTRSLARESCTASTADTAYTAMMAQARVSPEAAELALEAREFVRDTYADDFTFFTADGHVPSAEELKLSLIASMGVQKTISDFEHNLLTAARSEAIEIRLIGIAAYIVEAYRRAQPKPAAADLDRNGLVRIFGMFGTAAAAKLKKPAIRLVDDGGRTLQLKLAKPTSANAGYIYVQGAVGSNAYYGKISPQGKFMPARACPDSVGVQLQAFSADPEVIAARYGKLTGCCCFCGRNLSDDRSTDVGYGKICAERFGLRWGMAAPAVAESAVEMVTER